MMVVDTSVFIDYFNGRESAQTSTLDDLLGKELIVVGDVVMMELLQGFRSERDFKTALSLLSQLENRSFLSTELAIKYAEMYRLLRSKGVTIRKSMDTIIAGYCIIHKLSLLQTDRDFEPFQNHLGLKLV